MPKFTSFLDAANHLSGLGKNIENGVLSLINTTSELTLKELNGTASPVDTGRFRNNWIFQADTPFEGLNISPLDKLYANGSVRRHYNPNSVKSITNREAQFKGVRSYERRPVSISIRKAIYDTSGTKTFLLNKSRINANRSFNVYIVNNLPYAQFLNEGSSPQAPPMFVQEQLYNSYKKALEQTTFLRAI